MANLSSYEYLFRHGKLPFLQILINLDEIQIYVLGSCSGNLFAGLANLYPGAGLGDFDPSSPPLRDDLGAPGVGVTGGAMTVPSTPKHLRRGMSVSGGSPGGLGGLGAFLKRRNSIDLLEATNRVFASVDPARLSFLSTPHPGRRGGANSPVDEDFFGARPPPPPSQHLHYQQQQNNRLKNNQLPSDIPPTLRYHLYLKCCVRISCPIEGENFQVLGRRVIRIRSK